MALIEIGTPNIRYESEIHPTTPPCQPKTGFTPDIIRDEIHVGSYNLQYVRTHIATELHIGSLSEEEAKRLEQEAIKAISHRKVR